jgi:hypothetical protein
MRCGAAIWEFLLHEALILAIGLDESGTNTQGTYGTERLSLCMIRMSMH